MGNCKCNPFREGDSGSTSEVFFTQYDDRKKIPRKAKEDCRNALKEKFIEIPIPTNTKVEQAGSRQTPLYAHLDPYGKATLEDHLYANGHLEQKIEIKNCRNKI